ncbi:hypothetical protein BJV78DRAFT_1158539 [Lactifluus subvellereus]|nr:hypothetical protein BJV78DRAFT_1158539 [Lactifluus subvellereus]
MDGCALVCTVESLEGYDKREQVLANIPAVCHSEALVAPRDAFKTPNDEKMEALVELMLHTFSSGIVPGLKDCRIEISSSAMDAASLPITRPILQRVIYEDWDGLLNTVEFGLLLTAANYRDPNADKHSNWVVTAILTAAQGDDRWFELAARQLGISRSDP